MSCNCRSELLNKIREQNPEYLSALYLNYDIISGRNVVEVEVNIKGKKHPKVLNILASYCPHCGLEFELKKVPEEQNAG